MFGCGARRTEIPTVVSVIQRQPILGVDFKNRFNFDSNGSWQRVGPKSASSSHPGIFTEDIPKQLTATIDHCGLLIKGVCTADQT